MEFINNIVDEFKKLPSVGEKTALRFVLYYIKNKSEAKHLIDKLSLLYNDIKLCEKCNNVVLHDSVCNVCSDTNREKKICVISNISELISMENSAFYKGYYFVLPNLINPLKGVFEEDIEIEKLVDRIKEAEIKEVIFLFENCPEADITISYISDYIPENVKVSRPASGIPIGANLEFIDDQTLETAFENRKKI